MISLRWIATTGVAAAGTGMGASAPARTSRSNQSLFFFIGASPSPPRPRRFPGGLRAPGPRCSSGRAGAELLLEAVELELASLEAQGQRGVVAHRLLADAAGLLDAAELLQRPRPQEERFGVARIELQAIRQGAGGLFPLALPQGVQAEVETDVGVAGVGLEGAGKIAGGGGRLPRPGREHGEVHPYRLC